MGNETVFMGDGSGSVGLQNPGQSCLSLETKSGLVASLLKDKIRVSYVFP